MKSICKSVFAASRSEIALLNMRMWLLLCVGMMSFGAFSVEAQTNINIGTTVKQAGAKRFGINLANQNFYDNGMMLRNVIFRNPGFEGQTWTTILVCSTVTSTSCQDSNPYSTWPANFMQNATYTFMTGPAAGLSGTVTSQDAASYTANTGVVLHYAAPSIQPNSGDYLQLRITTPGGAERGSFIQNQSGAVLSTNTNPSDQAPGTTGTQCLEVTGPNSGQSVVVSQLFDTTIDRSFIQLNGSYTISFKAKSTGGSNQFNLQVTRLSNPQAVYLNQMVNLTNSWATYSYTFNTAETGSAKGFAEAVFNFNGNSLLLDDVQMSPDKNVYGTAFRDEVVSTLLTLKPGVLRYMDTAQGLGTSLDNILKDQFGRQRAGWSTQGSTIDTVPVGLYDFLRLCQVVGAEPWWTMPAAMNKSEMQHVMEYMAGSSSTPYGAIRAAQGQAAPWTTVFPVIHLELGNEVWNGGSFSGETIVSPDRFGQWANTVFSAAKATAYYAGAASKFDLVIGSLEVNDFWTQWELDACPACDTVAVASYMFGNLSDYSSTEAIFGPLMAYPQWLDGAATSGNNNHMYNQVQVANGISVPDAYGTKNPAAVAIYETNLGTNSGTAPQSVVNSVVPSVGAGIATANHMLMMLRDLGVKTQNMFSLTEYLNGFNGPAASSTPLWGTVVDMGGPTNLKRPQFLAEQLANTGILPTMLATIHTGDDPTWNQPLSANDSVQLDHVHYLQSYAFTDGTHQNLVVFNLHRTASLPVTFSGPGAPSGSIKVGRLTSANITDTNEISPIVNITYTNIANLDPTKPYLLPPFSMTVFQPGTPLPTSTTTLTATPTSGNVGQNVSLSAVVTAQSGTTTPTGTVTFLDGSTSLGTGTLDPGGVANFSTTRLGAGPHSITASYGGDSADSNSVSSAASVSITQTMVATTTTLSATATTATTGQSVSFTATVTPQSGTVIPTGTVTFSDGAATLGTGTLNASGAATFSTTTLSMGAHAIKASYGGDTKDAASASSTVSVIITQTVVATAIALTASPTTATTGQNVSFTAVVAPTSGSSIPTGTVTFSDGAATLGTGTLNASGAATFSTTTLSMGAHAIKASYGGDTKDAASASSTVSVSITQTVVATAIALTASPTTATTGQNVSFTAVVAPTSGSSIPTGTVTFSEGVTALGTGTLNASGMATFNTTSLGASVHNITATYAGDSKDTGSASTAILVTISQATAATTTILTASGSTEITGQNVAFVATVAPQSGSSVPSGSVRFSEGATMLGSGTLNSGGVATFNTSTLSVGPHSIAAAYGGDRVDTPSASSAVTVTISQAAVATTVALALSSTTANTGQSVSFTATVAPVSGTTIPTGTVAFSDGATLLGTVPLNASGAATMATTSLAVGIHTITAAYGGDAKNVISISAAAAVTVSQTIAATATSLTTSAATAVAGQSLTFNVYVASRSGSGVPTGVVSFLDGSVLLGTGTLTGAGAASFSTTTLAIGSHTVTASYGGDAKDATSSSSAVSVIISQPVVGTSTSLIASPALASVGQSVSFSATVTPQSGTGIPAGSVTFLDGGVVIGVGTLDANGTAGVVTGTLGVGMHRVTAAYKGDIKNAASASPAVTVSVSQVILATSTILSASPTQSVTGQSVAFTSAVIAQGGTTIPTGTITFFNGQSAINTAPLDATGVATFNTASLAPGTYSITASYSGDQFDSVSVSTAISVTVSTATATPPDYTMALNIPNLSVAAGKPASATVSVIPQNGFNQTIQLSCSGLPSGASCSFTPSSVTPSRSTASTTLTIAFKGSASLAAPPIGAPLDGVTYGMMMPWGLVTLLGITVRTRNSRTRGSWLSCWTSRLVVTCALIGASLGMTGCGFTLLSRAGRQSAGTLQTYIVTISAAGPSVPTHTSELTLQVTA